MQEFSNDVFRVHFFVDSAREHVVEEGQRCGSAFRNARLHSQHLQTSRTGNSAIPKCLNPAEPLTQNGVPPNPQPRTLRGTRRYTCTTLSRVQEGRTHTRTVRGSNARCNSKWPYNFLRPSCLPEKRSRGLYREEGVGFVVKRSTLKVLTPPSPSTPNTLSRLLP